MCVESYESSANLVKSCANLKCANLANCESYAFGANLTNPKYKRQCQ